MRASAQALRSAALIGVGGGRELLPDLDLPALARRVQAETAPGSRAPRHAPGARV